MSSDAMQVRDTAPHDAAAVDRQEVPPGCEQTEVGLKAEEWRLVPLHHMSDFITKGSTPTTYGFHWESCGILFLRSECVSPHGLDLDQSMFISPAAHEMLRRSEVHDGDLLVTITGNVGRVVLLRGVSEANINQHIARVRISARDVHPRYVYHVLSQVSFRQRFESITTGQAYPQISLKQVRETPIPLPQLPEQRAIAGALSDVDELLGVLEALIAKKRAIKQAAMQQLLTGRTRLPGFDGLWIRRKLGEIAGIAKGKQPMSETVGDHGRYPYLNGGMEFSGYSLAYNSSANTITVSEGGNSCGFVKFMFEPFWCGGHCYTVRPIRTDNEFLYQALKVRQSALMELRVGSGLPNIQRSDLQAFEIFLPQFEEEQSAIAQVLSDMDAETAALITRRDKTRAIKQGMMQQLLTGRVRLIEPAPEVAAA